MNDALILGANGVAFPSHRLPAAVFEIPTAYLEGRYVAVNPVVENAVDNIRSKVTVPPLKLPRKSRPRKAVAV